MKGQTERLVPFTARDGRPLNLIHIRSETETNRGPVLLVHGAGVRGNIFRAPVETNFVQTLLDNGYDVWLENWRASIEFPPNEWDLDQAALYDHPAAVEKVVEETGADEIKAVIHCQGSTSFTMSAIAGLVPQVKTIVSNAVSLHPIVPKWSSFKINAILPTIAPFSRYLNPYWGVEAPTLFAKLIRGVVNLTHHECDNAVCKGVSFTYGSGFPALWSHENLNDATHDWLSEEFKAVPIRFFKHIKKCIRKGNLVSMTGSEGLPADFAAESPRTDARFAFFAGEQNRCFLAEAQIASHRWFDSHAPGRHALHVFPDYGHLDIFIGKNAARDVFPSILHELQR